MLMLGSGPWTASGLPVARDTAGPPGTCSRAAGGRGAHSRRGGGWHAPSSACLPANPEIKLHDSLTTPIKHLIDGVALYYLTPRANKQCRESSPGHTVIKVPGGFHTEPAWARLTRGPSTPQRPTKGPSAHPSSQRGGPPHPSGRRGGPPYPSGRRDGLSAHPSGQTRCHPRWVRLGSGALLMSSSCRGRLGLWGSHAGGAENGPAAPGSSQGSSAHRRAHVALPDPGSKHGDLPMPPGPWLVGPRP